MLSIGSRIGSFVPDRYQGDLRVGRELWRGEAEIRLLPALLSGGGTFIDVGGNLGTYAVYACRFTKSVEVFEPHPTLSRALRATLGARASVHEIALSDRAGNVVFHIPVLGEREIHSRGSIETCHAVDFARMRDVEVECRRLDDYEFDSVSVIKIDVEGHEAAVLRGATETLRKHGPTVIVEVEDFRMPGCFEDVHAMMHGHGYDGFFIRRGRIESLKGFDIARHQAPELRQAYGGRRNPDFVNNFIFQPRGAGRLGVGMEVPPWGPRAGRQAH